MNALSLITGLPSNKIELDSYFEKAKLEILSGDYNPLTIEIQLKVMEDFISRMRKDAEIKSALTKEVDKYSEKVIDFAEFKITKSQKTTYDYSASSEWVLIKEKIKLIEDKMKLAMKTDIADSESGECVPMATAKVTEFLKIEYKK